MKQVFDVLVAEGYMTCDGDRYSSVSFTHLGLHLPFSEDEPVGMLDMLAAEASPGEVFRVWARSYAKTALKCYRLAQVAHSDARLEIYDPVKDTPDQFFVELWAPTSTAKEIVQKLDAALFEEEGVTVTR